MGYYVRTALGVALIVGGIGFFAYSITELADIGNCASGGPYEIANECPSDTGGKVGTLTGSIFAFVAGVFLFALRGSRPTKPGLPTATTSSTPDWGNFGTFGRPQTPQPTATRAPGPAPVVTPPPQAAPPPKADPVERLAQLNELREKGTISEAEFASAKARILAEL